MKDKLLHTPEGVRDIYNAECRAKLKLQHDLHQVLEQYGFCDIQTPSFEFLISLVRNEVRSPQKICISFLIVKATLWY